MTLRARTLVAGTVGLGAAAIAMAAAFTPSSSLRALALFAAAAAFTELFTIPADSGSLNPLDAHGFSISIAVHLAAVLIVGPWPAALVAAFGVLATDSFGRRGFHRVAYNASVFALAAVAGGLVFEALGGHPGAVSLPRDFGAIAALAATAYGVNTLFIGSIIALTRQTSLLALQRDKLLVELPSVSAEAGLGVTIALFVQLQPWALVALVPLASAVYLSRARVAVMRRETAHALETFANIVDERDTSTYRHSSRVAEYVRELAAALRLPSAQIAALRWAGRLHDLGKVRVDAAVLRKEGGLTDDEWDCLRLHPRLSARLLRRFRIAAREAQAVEYHHERADGRGYYGVDPGEIPLAAHFIIVADAYDAMTSDRPYRRAMSHAAALAEIEDCLGTQFHPAVGKAFVAVQRGRNPLSILTSAELAELRHLGDRGPRRRTLTIRAFLERPEWVTIVGGVAALVGWAAGAGPYAASGLLLAVGGAVTWAAGLRRAGRLAQGMVVAASARDPGTAFSAAVGRVVDAADLRWSGLVRWSEEGLNGTLDLEWNGGPHRPTESALISWLTRDAEAREELLLAPGSEVGCGGVCAAVPLRSNGTLVGYWVLLFGHRVPSHVRLALIEARRGLEETALALPELVRVEQPALVAVS